nr:MAG: VP1 protein [Solemoviridae sp. 2]
MAKTILLFVSVLTNVIFGLYIFRHQLDEEIRLLSVFSTQEILEELWFRHSSELKIVGLLLLLLHLPYYFKILFNIFKLIRGTFRFFLGVSVKTCSTIREYSFGVDSVVPYYYQPEKFMAGSPYEKVPAHKSQLEIRVQVDGEWRLLGQGFRLNSEHLVTAYHVISDVVQRGTNTLRLVNSSNPNKYIDVAVSIFANRKFDICSAVLPPAVWSELQITTPTIPALATRDPTTVSVSSGKLGSRGLIQTMDQGPYMSYLGSTKEGFSGAPYYIGNTILAMHIGAGKANLAIDINFVSAVVFKKEAIDYSDSAEKLVRHLTSVADSGRKISYRSMDPSEIYVYFNGKYMSLDYDTLSDKIKSSLEYDREPRLVGESALVYDDEIEASVSKNEPIPRLVRAGASTLKKNIVAAAQNSLEPTSILQSPQVQDILMEALVGQLLTRVQSKDPSDSTATSLLTRLEDSQNKIANLLTEQLPILKKDIGVLSSSLQEKNKKKT